MQAMQRKYNHFPQPASLNLLSVDNKNIISKFIDQLIDLRCGLEVKIIYRVKDVLFKSFLGQLLDYIIILIVHHYSHYSVILQSLQKTNIINI